jgi:hypothetical protein
MSDLESRARRLLRCYPPAYRADRGEEILGTLLEARQEGSRWPSFRDARSLVTGGLRARSAANRQLPFGTNLRLAVILGVALWLSRMPAAQMHVEPFWTRPAYAICALLVVATLAAIWFARRGVTIGLALVTAVAIGLLTRHVDGQNAGAIAVFVLPPVVLAAVVAAEPVRPPRSWIWLPAGFLTASALLYLQDLGFLHPTGSAAVGDGATLIMLGLVAAIVLWLITDARPLVAFIVALALAVDPGVALAAVDGWVTGPQGVVVLVPLAVGALVAVRLRQKAGARA